MSLLLADAARLTQNKLVKGIIETLITESAVLRYLPFVGLDGTTLTYNREATTGTASFYAVSGTWTEDATTVTQATAALKIMGGDVDVDQFLQQTYTNTNNLRALAVEEKSKAVAYKFNDAFFNGDSSSDANSFDGVKKTAGTVNNALTGYSATVRAASNGANGATLTLDTMDIVIDQIKPGKPHALFMSKRSRRKLSSLRRAAGNILEVDRDQFGRRVVSYDGIPVEVDENIPDNETQGTNSDCSSIYPLQFGFRTGICGLDNGGIQAMPIGNLETKDAWRTRIKWYVGLAYFRTIAYARLAGVRD